MDKSGTLKHLVPGTIVEEHLTTCKLGPQKCGLCAVHQAWVSHKKPWLRVVLVEGEAKLGCSTCAKAGWDGPWAQFQQPPGARLRKHNLDRHEQSKGHRKAMESNAVELSISGAPPAEDFKTCLQGMMQGQSARQGGVCSDKKNRMRYALSEAICSRNRKLLSEAHHVSLMRDERKGKLLVRFKAVLKDLTTVHGVFGMCEVPGSAESIAAATADSMQSFCQPMRQPPRGSKAEEQPVDAELLRKIQESVTIVVTDAAASELLAGDLERGRRAFADQMGQANLTSVKLIGRDVAHASTRLLKRPFQSCEALRSIMTEWIHGSDSFAQKVHHSHILSQWWAKAVQCQEDSDLLGHQCTSLAAAKHRFSSYFNPLSRIVKNLQAVFNVCGRVQAMRGADAAWATQLCQNFSSFKAVLLAMAADAAAISNDYCRQVDREEVDVATLNMGANHFISSARALFVDRQVLTLPTFTKELLDRKASVTILQDGFAYDVKVSPADLDRAFAHMEDRILIS